MTEPEGPATPATLPKVSAPPAVGRAAGVRTLSPTLRRAYLRIQEVSDAEIERYLPLKIDIRVAESILDGCNSPPAIARRIGADEKTVRRVINNPVRMAWISRQLTHHYAARVGLVDQAMFEGAVAGKTDAARLFYARQGLLAGAPASQHAHVHLEFNQLSDGELRKVIAEKLRRANLGLEQPIDVEAE